MMRMPKVVLPDKKSLAQKKTKGEDEKEAPFPGANVVNNGKTQTAAVAEMLRYPKVVLPEKKSLAQKKSKGEDEKEAPFPGANAVNNGKT
jgi:hypothetical protein